MESVKEEDDAEQQIATIETEPDGKFLTSESDQFYSFTLVCPYVCHALISETAPGIFSKLGIKLGVKR